MSSSDSKKEVKKFLFDSNDFNSDFITPEEETPPPVYTQEDLDAAKTTAFEKGRMAALKESQESREKYIQDLVSSMSTHMTDLFEQEEARIKLYENEAVNLTHAILKRFFPILNKKYGIDEVIGTIQKIMENNHAHPNLKILVCADDLKDIQETLSKTLKNDNENFYQLTEGSSLTHGDCEITWDHGGARRYAVDLFKKIEVGLHQMLADKQLLVDNEDSLEEKSPDTTETSDTEPDIIEDNIQIDDLKKDSNPAEKKSSNSQEEAQ